MDVGVERGFESVYVDKVVVEAEIDSCCLFLALLGCEGAVEVLNSLVQFAAGKRERSYVLWMLSARIAVEEAVQSM